ncbi:aKG-HExxH-type peptide beta-hydroxylase [Actinoplanes solisilvae]|uniref:aKG-HExxH-type peptide beta-hydroxylase n=1 Tax=Actinoplanes solisilvae TaxID=2486853 RepID=UPI000FD99504|nr:HEXXH motif-containing putative peptide modification protein [Actinoplanes solisilvae]
MQHHRLTPSELDALAGGTGSVPAIEEISASRVSLHLLLLKHLSDEWPGDRAPLEAAIAVLAEVQERRPEVYLRLLGDPLVGAWLGRAERVEQLEIGNLAAAAAISAGLSCRLPGVTHAGRLVIPTLGSVPASDPVTIVVEDGATSLIDDPGWRPMRWLRAGPLSVRLDDASPYRAGYHAAPAERLSDAEAAHWQGLLSEAWGLIEAYLPERAVEMAAGLRVLVPLVDLGDGSSRSGTARVSVGAMGLTRPRSAADFAVTLVHEFEHSKLSGVLDLLPLYVPGTERHHAPWRKDRRPTSGLIQGVLAFTRVAEAWQRFRAVPALAETATAEFAMISEQVRVGYQSLAGSKELTDTGARFVAGMRPAVDRLLTG